MSGSLPRVFRALSMTFLVMLSHESTSFKIQGHPSGYGAIPAPSEVGKGIPQGLGGVKDKELYGYCWIIPRDSHIFYHFTDRI